MQDAITQPPDFPPAFKISDHRAILFVLIAGLYIRLMLASFPGFPDTNDFVTMVRFTHTAGLSSITNWSAGSITNFGGSQIPQYPPGFIYQASAASEAVHLLTRHKPAENQMAITPRERLGVRIGPMGCDLLIAVLLYLTVSRAFSRTSAVWAASLYLLNPGVIANSALWNFDAVPSFLMLLSLLLCALAFERANYAWLSLGMAFCAIAVSTKLQAVMFIPVVGAFVLLTKRIRVAAVTTFVFCLVSLLFYVPFLIEGNLEYLRRVFFASFEYGQVTQLNAYNVWALWFQIPNTTRVLGVSLGNIGRIAYLASAAYAIHALWTRRPAQEPRQGITRRFAIFGAYLSIAPFMLLTQMHERYIATAIPLAVLAGFLDRRLMVVAIGFSLTYALNLLAVGVHYWQPWDLSETSQYFEPVRLLFIVNRVFCSLLNVGLLIWLTARLRNLLATPPVSAQPSASRL